MWFKTRKGFVSVLEPFEIGASKFAAARLPAHYSVWAQGLASEFFRYKGILGTASATGQYWQHLAKFHVTDSAGPAITHCMELIEEAIIAKAHLCDLGLIGDALAWGNDRYLPEWRRREKTAVTLPA